MVINDNLLFDSQAKHHFTLFISHAYQDLMIQSSSSSIIKNLPTWTHLHNLLYPLTWHTSYAGIWL